MEEAIGETSKWIICRICLKQSPNVMLKICDPMSAGVQDLVQQIELCGGICLDVDADLPDSMCSKCELLLRAAHKFRVLCQRSQEQIVQMLQMRDDVNSSITEEQQQATEEIQKCPNEIELGMEHGYYVKKEHDSDAATQDNSNHGDEVQDDQYDFVPEEKENEELQEFIDEEGEVDYNEADIICSDMVMEELEENEVQDQVDCEYIELPHDHIGFLQDDSSQNLISDEMSNISYSNEQHFQIVQEIAGTDSVNSNEDAVLYEAKLESAASEALGNKRKRQQNNESDHCDGTGASQFQVVEKFSVSKARGSGQVSMRKRRAKTKREVVGSLKDQGDHEPPTYICCHCGNMYNERAKLTLHMKNHQTDKEKPHECEICHKRFAQTPQLARHMNSHTGSRPFKCKFCTASFADPSTCIKHQRIHTKERPFKCEVCFKDFTYSNVLKVHMMIHTGEKPFSCMHCDKKFSQLHHKKSHERSHNMTENVLKMDEDSLDMQ